MLYMIYSNLKSRIYDKNSKDLLKIDVLKFPSGWIYLNDIIFRLEVSNLDRFLKFWVVRIVITTRDKTRYYPRTMKPSKFDSSDWIVIMNKTRLLTSGYPWRILEAH